MNKKKVSILGWALGLSMALAGVGVAVGASQGKAIEAQAGEEVFYQLNPVAGTNENYASNCDIAVSGITWNLTGNSKMIPWRMGGKSISKVDRALYSKTAMSADISKIEVTFGAASNITVHSFTVIVDDNADFSSAISTLTPTFRANNTVTITKPAGVDWSNAYYKFVLNVSVSGSSNKFVAFSGAKFYQEVANKYTVTYDANGGTCSTESEEIVENGHPSLPTPTRANHTFDGWQIDGEGEYITSDYEVTGDVTLVAHWTAIGQVCTITYDANGGTVTPSSEDVLSGGHPTLPVPTKAHHTFNGWQIDGEGEFITSDFTVTGNVTLVANWTEDPTYVVTYVAGENGSGENHVVGGVYAGEYALIAFSETGLQANEGYRFKNYTIGEENKNPGENIEVSGNVTVTVNFEVMPLESTYDFVSGFSSYASTWNNSYITRGTLSGKDALGGSRSANVNLFYASKQTQNITDRPVFATKTASGSWTKVLGFELLEEGYRIQQVSVEFKQWLSKTPDVALFGGTEAAGTPLDTATIGTKNTLTYANLNLKVFSVGYCDKNTGSNVQAGLNSIYVSLSKDWSRQLLEQFTCSGVTELYPDGAITVAHPEIVWGNVADVFDGISDAEKLALKTMPADEAGTIDEQALARYDLVVRKYGYTDFIGRFAEGGINYGSSNAFNRGNTYKTTLPLILGIVGVGTLAIGALFLLKKRRKEN